MLRLRVGRVGDCEETGGRKSTSSIIEHFNGGNADYTDRTDSMQLESRRRALGEDPTYREGMKRLASTL